MLRGSLAFIEKFFWAMVFIFVIIIVGFWILAQIENRGNGNVLGNFAQWINDHARPQAS